MISDYLENSIQDTTYSLYVINTKQAISNKIDYKIDSNLPNNKEIYVNLLASTLDVDIGKLLINNSYCKSVYFDLIISNTLFSIRVISNKVNWKNTDYLDNKLSNKDLIKETINKEIINTLELLGQVDRFNDNILRLTVR